MTMLRRLGEITPGVLIATARPFSTVTTVLLDGVDGAVVVDPAWLPDELAALPGDLADLSLTCVAGVATHEHYDHVLWHAELGAPPRWASATTVHRLASQRTEILRPAAQFLTPDLLELAGRLDVLTSDVLPWRGPETVVIRHDAHAPGHLGLFQPATGVLVAGDMLSDIELPMPADGDVTLETYLSGLDVLRPYVAQARWLIPGHGAPTNQPAARLAADDRYLDDLLSRGRTDDPRVALPGMPELHTCNLERARAMR